MPDAVYGTVTRKRYPNHTMPSWSAAEVLLSDLTWINNRLGDGKAFAD